MLKKRIIATLIIREGVVVQSIGFNKYLPVGKPQIAVEFLNNWGIDEIVLLDISATKSNLRPDFDLVKKIAKKCFVPLAVGGGIKTVNDVRLLTQSGADKVVLNSVCIQNVSIINEIAASFGNQCIIASVDLKMDSNNIIGVYDYISKSIMELPPIEYMKLLEKNGVGEILLNFVDRDGQYNGFDIEAINSLKDCVSIPIIVQGGAKDYCSFVDLFKNTNIDAAAASNFYHFSEHSVIITKAQLKQLFDSIRVETFSTYIQNKLDTRSRLSKKMDFELENLLYIKVEKEII